MQLWEYVLKADNELDLADPARAWGWFSARPWVPIALAPTWDEADRTHWQMCVLAFRLLVPRLTTRKPKRPTGHDDESEKQADLIFREYLQRMQPVPQTRHGSSSRNG